MPEEVLGINSALQNYSSYSCDSAAETGIFLHSHAGVLIQAGSAARDRRDTLSKEKPSLGTGSPCSSKGNFRCAIWSSPEGQE